jgi:hypothetical protein
MPSSRTASPETSQELLPRTIWTLKLNGQLQAPKQNLLLGGLLEQEPEADGDGEQLSAQGYIPHTELYGGLWSNVRCAHLQAVT